MATEAIEKTLSIGERNKELIYTREQQFADAWGSATKAKQFMLAAANAINSDANLQECTDASKLSCLMQISQWGLMPGKSMGHIFLVPFKNGDLTKAAKRDVYEATIIVGYKGYSNLAYRSGLVLCIQSRVVYEKDIFKYALGSSAFVEHVPSEEKNRGKRRGVYLIIDFKNGSKFIDFMTAEEIAPVKAFALKSKKGFSPWQGDFEDEMWRKCPLRRDAKYLPLGEIFEQAVAYESERETEIAKITSAEFTDVTEHEIGAISA
jgi:recombination protein RecT